MSVIFSFILSALGAIVKPVFDFLNKRVDSAERIHVSDNATLSAITTNTQTGITAADNLNAQIRIKEGVWSPWTIVTICGFMVPLGFHTWQVVIDSSKWLIGLGPYYLPYIYQAREHVEKLPGQFELTEHAVIQSLFIGAGVAVGAIPIIKLLKR